MSRSHHQRHRSRSHSRSSTHKREFYQNRNKDRSKDYDRRADSYEGHHHTVQSNRSYNYPHLLDLTLPIDEIINHAEEHPPVVQSLVRELLLEQKKRKLMEERLSVCQHDYALLHAQYEQTVNNVALLKHDYDKCRIDLKNGLIEVNELRHSNCQLRAHIDHRLNNERPQMYTDDEMFYTKRQRRH